MPRPIPLDLSPDARPLRAMRDAAGATQEELAEALGIAQPTVAIGERASASTLSLARLMAVAKALGGKLVVTFEPPKKKSRAPRKTP